MKLNVTFKENNEVLRADFGEVSVVGSSGNVQNPLEHLTDISGMYQGILFPNDYEITLDLPNTTNLSNLFENATNVKKVTLKGNLNKGRLVLTEAFQRCSQLKTLDVSEFSFRPRNADRTFSLAYDLEEIIGYIDLTWIQSATDIFDNCTSLKEVRFFPNNIPGSFSLAHSSLLSAESIQSIIDGLKDLSSAGYQQTLTLYGGVVNSLTDEQLTTIFNKNWVVM